MKKNKPDLMHRIAQTIIDLRIPITLAAIVAAIFCAVSIGKVRTNSDLTAFLSDDMETRRGLTVMQEEFVTYGSASVMVSNITYEKAAELADEIRDVRHVLSVDFDDTAAHYVNSSALFSVSFDGPAEEETVQEAYRKIKDMLSGYDLYCHSEVGENLTEQIAGEMVGVVAISAAVIIVILLFTSRSYFEVVIFGIVFVFAALLNMGTNFWLGEISSITNAIAVILQLALAIDYAIIFAHRYQDEAMVYPTHKEALVEALAKSILEISSSSLTTISGLVALMFMEFGLGYDLGMVLAKGILCSLLTVFLVMPALIMYFPAALKRSLHRNLVPDISGWGRFLMKSGFCFVWLFILILPFAIRCYNGVNWCFSEAQITEIIHSDSRFAMHKISDTFSNDTMIAVLVPAEDFDKEKLVLNEVAQLDGIKSATGLANIEIDDGHVLTDEYDTHMFSELVGVEIEEARLLFIGYGYAHDQFQPIFQNVDTYKVPLVDLFIYLIEKVDQGMVTLDDETTETLDGLRETLNMGLDQLRGENYNRLVFSTTLPVQGKESEDMVERIRGIAEQYYDEGSVIITGDITSCRDLAASYNSDSTLINILTIVMVYAILLFTFKSIVGSLIMVMVIQGSIWINFSFTYLEGHAPCFVTGMIVSAIQMGATIDYAIVIMNRYLVRRQEYDAKPAMVKAVNDSFATVLTSGTIMSIAGTLIGYRVTDVYVGHIGLAIGRGAFISVILVLTVLPQLTVLLDKPIRKTMVELKLTRYEEEAET